MKRISFSNRFFQFVNTYSIWVALGSYASHMFFCKLYGTSYNSIIAVGLALGVWFIYTLDHLLDGLVLRSNATTVRHKKHFDHRFYITRLLIVVALALIILSFRVPSQYLPFIGLLLLLTIVHFGINYLVPKRVKKLLFLKEVFIALVVSLGIASSALVGEFKINSHWSNLPFCIFLFINLANIMLFSYFDKEADQRSKTLSIASIYSDLTLKGIIYLCLLLSLVFSSYEYVNGELGFLGFAIFLSMQITLLIIALFSSYFQRNDRYRFFGDLIYVYPLAVMPFL
ncbi:MAG: hypothetical protein ACI8S2_001455 [Bacteroidia bacterium]|jgi:hypothetical protein